MAMLHSLHDNHIIFVLAHTTIRHIVFEFFFRHHTKIRRFTMVCRSPHLLFSVRCYKKAIEKNSCVFSGSSMWKIAKKTEISKASMKLGQTPWTFPPHQQRMRMRNAILLYPIRFRTTYLSHTSRLPVFLLHHYTTRFSWGLSPQN